MDIMQSFENLNFNVINTKRSFTAKRRIKFYGDLSEIIQFHSNVKELIIFIYFSPSIWFFFCLIVRKFTSRLCVILETFCFFAVFFSTRITDRFSDTYSSLLTASFAVSSVLLCSALLGLNAVLNRSVLCFIFPFKFVIFIQALYIGVADICRLFVCFAVMKMYIVVLCLFGDDVTKRFAEAIDSIYLCSWDEFPLDSQKLFPMVLMLAQKPVYIHGYMNVRCTRESIKIVIFFPFDQLKTSILH